jgi:4-aminobutyrate aminotransferase-like enzyme
MNTRYISPIFTEYCKALTDLFPEPLNYCFLGIFVNYNWLVNSGSEANELALRLARNYKKSKETVIVDYNYHGNS